LLTIVFLTTTTYGVICLSSALAFHELTDRIRRLDRAGPRRDRLPVLLDQSAPRLRAYPYEAIVAEKFQAMVMLGRANSWMKDFYDIWTLAQSYAFDDDRLALNCRDLCTAQTEIPTERLDALTPAFGNDGSKQGQWAAFLEDVAVNPGTLPEV
jgi:hypothetical protein